jgi:hypothetical protein
MNKLLLDSSGFRIPHIKLAEYWNKFLQHGNVENSSEPFLYLCKYDDNSTIVNRAIYCMNKIFWGIFIEWKADLLYDQSTYDQRKIDILSQYDIIISTDNWTPVMPNNITGPHGKQIRLQMPSEPFDNNFPLGNDSCPVMIDNYGLTTNFSSVQFWYHYRVKDLQVLFHYYHTLTFDRVFLVLHLLKKKQILKKYLSINFMTILSQSTNTLKRRDMNW